MCTVISVTLCMHVYLSARVSQKTNVLTSPNLRRMLPLAAAQSSSGSVAIRYVLPVLWLTVYFDCSIDSSVVCRLTPLLRLIGCVAS